MNSCPICVDLGLTSEISQGGGEPRLGKPYPFIDNEGVTHFHETMHKYDKYSCSNGHNWKIKRNIECEICGHRYEGPEEINE